MQYEEAMQYIHSIAWTGSRPGLERINELCTLMHHPERTLKYIHVVGTNGKGSFCRMLSEVFTAAGYKTGLFTSPYIETFNERMQIDGEDITNDELAEITGYVKPLADRMTDLPTEFELITAVGFEYFRRNCCDVVVLEAGLGGRLDSTNVIPSPELVVVTGIDYDHTAILGDTLAKIAAEKAGVIKPDTTVLFGEGLPEAEKVIHETTRRICGEDAYHRTDYTRIENPATSLDGSDFSFAPFGRIHLTMLGIYQFHNAANVLTAIELLRMKGYTIPDSAVYKGMARAKWKARFEILNREPLILYDGAHNPQGIAAADVNIRRYLTELTSSGKIHLLMGVLADKDYRAMIRTLAPYAAHVVTITPPSPRALDASETAAVFLENGVTAIPAETVAQGVCLAADGAKREKMPLFILGSLYLYGDVKKALTAYLADKNIKNK